MALILRRRRGFSTRTRRVTSLLALRQLHDQTRQALALALVELLPVALQRKQRLIFLARRLLLLNVAQMSHQAS
ncbi:hypothetical protein [Vreelandella gomseomensis]|uniref:hypothetical protein n=1 Tax=Vreelandella gomseomensis TaxID=370766 RepID=UPI003BF4F9AF